MGMSVGARACVAVGLLSSVAACTEDKPKVEFEVVKNEIEDRFEDRRYVQYLHVEVESKQPDVSFVLVTPDGKKAYGETCRKDEETETFVLEMPVEPLKAKKGKVAFQVWGRTGCGFGADDGDEPRATSDDIVKKEEEATLTLRLQETSAGTYELGSDCAVTFEKGKFTIARGDKACGTWKLGGTKLTSGKPVSCKGAQLPEAPLTRTGEIPVTVTMKGSPKVKGNIHGYDVETCLHDIVGGVAEAGVVFKDEPAAAKSPKTLLYFKSPTEYESFGRGRTLGDVDLVALDKTNRHERVCHYEGGVTDTAYSWDHDVKVYDRRTGKETAKKTFRAPPPTCAGIANVSSKDGKVQSGGGQSGFVDDKDLAAWFESLVK